MINQTIAVLITVLFVVGGIAPNALAEPLQYQRNNLQQLRPDQVQQAESSLVPLGYSPSYDPQFQPYASFMQSPYSGSSVQPQYQAPGGYGRLQQGSIVGTDPYGASEVSPYSRYSPYIEIVGEGSHYTLGVDDVVTIIVRNQPDFSGRFVIDPEENIQYPFVGDIKAAGKTKAELKAEIIERLKKYVRYPEVAVMISQYRSKAVYVFGHVNRPGKYAMKGDKITIKEAIVAAGLPTGDAALKRVFVIRPSEFTEDGQAHKRKVNVKKLLLQGDSSEDFILQPGDTVIVNQRYYDKFINGFSRVVGPLFQAAAVYELGFGDKDGGFLGGGK